MVAAMRCIRKMFSARAGARRSAPVLALIACLAGFATAAAQGQTDTILHSFEGGPQFGAFPHGNLTLVGATLYGITALGGQYDEGVIFQVGVSGTGLAVLHSFESGRSTEVETFSRICVWPSICLRIDSTAACDRRNRLASALSSRSRPSSRCSVSM